VHAFRSNLADAGTTPPLDGGVADARSTLLSGLTCVTVPNSVMLYECNYGDTPENFDPSRVAFQGHSRSLEPTRIDRLPMTSY